MSPLSGRKFKQLALAALVIGGVFCYLSTVKAWHSTSTYAKPFNGTLTATEWNNLLYDGSGNIFGDFVNTWLPASMNGPLGIATSAPASGLEVNGPVKATSFIGAVTATLTAPNVSNGEFGSNTGGGNYSFPGNLGIGISLPTYPLHVYRSSGNYVTKFDSGTTGNYNTFSSTDGAGEYGIYQDAFYFQALSSLSNGIRFFDNSSGVTPSLVSVGGNIGIATSTPLFKLDVNGAANFNGNQIHGVGTPTVNTDAATKSYVDSVVGGGSGSAVGYWTMNGTNIFNNNAGNVGIGTSSPIAKLELLSTTEQLRLGYNPSLYTSFTTNSSGNFLLSPAGLSVKIGTSGVPKRLELNDHFKIYQTGADPSVENVANQDAHFIGSHASTNSPHYTLNLGQKPGTGHIQVSGEAGNVRIVGDFLAPAASSGSFSSLFVGGTINPDATVTGIARGLYVSPTITQLPTGGYRAIEIPTNNSSAYGIYQSGANTKNYFAGNVGIGTTTPDSKLQVTGVIKSGTIGTAGALALGRSSDGASHFSITSTGSNSVELAQTGGNSSKIIMNTTALTFQTYDGAALANRMTILQTSGNVGIGTTAPNDTFSIGNSGAAPAGSSATGHNYTSTYLSTDNYALTNYGLVKTLIAGGSGSAVGYWTMNGTNIYNNNSGNVGIGTTNPTSKLYVSGNIEIPETKYLQYYTGANYYGRIMLWDGANGNMVFDNKSGGTSHILLMPQGNVGIGTTAPVSPLEVSKSNVGNIVKEIIRNQDTSNTYSGAGIGFIQTTGDWGAAIFTDRGKGGSANQGGLYFNTGNVYEAFSASNTRMVLTNTGNVGIGTTVPNYKLDVAGGGRFTDSFYVTGGGASITRNSGATALTVTQSSTGNILDLVDGSTTIMTVLDGGNVGIGTTAPNDTFSIGNSGAAPAGSSATGHNYTSTYLSTDNYALANYGLVKTLVAGGSGSAVGYWTMNGINIYNNNAGNVGVGTTAPINKLTVYGVSGIGDIRTGFSDASSWSIGRDNLVSGDFVFVDGITTSTERMRIQHGTGNVGVGTTNPSTLFHIQKDQNAATTLFIGNANVGAGAVTKLSFGTAGTEYSYLEMNRNSNRLTLANTNPSVADIYLTPGTGGNLIVNSGNVGIGTIAPSAKLEVSGANNTNGIKITDTALTGARGTYLDFVNANNGNADPAGSIRFFANNTTNIASISAITGTNYTTGHLTFSTNNGTFSERMRIDKDGNVGVGATNPFSSLHVNRVYAGGVSPAVSGTVDPTVAARFQYGAVGFDTGILDSGKSFIQVRNVNDLAVNYSLLLNPNAGNVGIGTTAPNDTFSIGNSGAAPAGSSATGHNYTSTYLSTDNYALANYGLVKTLVAGGSGSAVGYWTMNGTNIYNNNSGNVGVGTTNPADKLDVEGTFKAGGISNYRSFNIDTTGRATFTYNDNATYPQITISNPNGDANSGDRILFKLGYGGTAVNSGYINSGPVQAWTSTASTHDSYLSFATTLDSLMSEKMRITSDGNVGIGTTTPGYALHIVGASPQFRVQNTTANSYVASKYVNTTNSMWIGVSNNTGSAFAGSNGMPFAGTIMTDAAYPLQLGTNGSPIINITSSGNVGIGTTAPNDTFSIGNSGAAPAGSSATGHNYTSTYLSTDNYALANYGLVKTLVAGGSGSAVGYWTMNGTNIYNNNSGNVGVGVTNPVALLTVRSSANNAIPSLSVALGNETAAVFGNTGTNGILALGNDNSGNFWLQGRSLLNNGTSETILLNPLGGNVGIGTTNPGNRLEVTVLTPNANQGILVRDYNDAAKSILITSSNGSTAIPYIGTNGANRLDFGTNAARQMTIDTSGNVGIGTVGPKSLLDIGSAGFNGTLSSNAFGSDIDFSIFQNAYTFNNASRTPGYKWVTTHGSFGSRGIRMSFYDGINFYADSAASTADTTFTPTSRMTITNNGSVGIGTTAPSQKLEVNGNIVVNSTITTPAATSLFFSPTSGSTYFNGSGVNNNFYAYDYSVGTPYPYLSLSAHSLVLNTPANGGYGTVRIVDSGSSWFAGNVGIGTTAPNDKFSIGSGGTAAPAGSADTGHNYTSTYLSTDNYALTNYGLVKTLIAGGSGSAVGYWTQNGTNIYNNNSGNVGIGTTAPSEQLEITKNFRLSTTSAAAPYGIIYKGTDRFIHDFSYGNNGTITPLGQNTFVGINSGNLTMGSTATQNYQASYNTGMGWSALNANTTGYYNTAIGHYAMLYNLGGFDNTALGAAAMQSNTSGGQNVAVGRHALFSNRAGNYGVAIGYQAMYYVNDSASSWNNASVALGFQALRGGTTAGNNTGNNNSAIGYQALYSNTTGSYNAGLGMSALLSNTSGNWNNAVGYLALGSNTTGSNNSAFGHTALYGNVDGAANSAIGVNAGRYIAGGSIANTSSGQSVYIGSETKSLTASDSNEIVIGYGATGIGTNSVVLGNDSIAVTSLKGNVGIGTTNPRAKLEINQGTANVAATLSDQSLLFSRSVDGQFTGGMTFDPATQLLNVMSNGGAGAINFKQNGADRMRIDSAGNVGVGTTAPNDKFSIGSGGTAAPAGSADTGHNYTSTYLSTDNYALANYGIVKTLVAGGSGSAVGYWTMNGTNIYNNNSGNVGVGTTVPRTKLDVTAANAIINIANDVLNAGDIGIQFSHNTLSVEKKTAILSQATGAWSRSDLHFVLNSDANSNNYQIATDTKMIIKNNGNVGIGTTAPIYKLDVSGSDVSGVTQRLTGDVNYGSMTAYWRGGSYLWSSGIGGSSSNNGVPVSYYGIVENNTTPRLVIAHTTGNVGIGTTAPGATLSVVNSSNAPAVSFGEVGPFYTAGSGPTVGIKARGSGLYDGLGIKSNDGTRWLILTHTGSAGVISTEYTAGGNTPIILQSYNQTNQLYLGTSGNVGIGTAAPNDKFSIASGGTAAPAGSDSTGHNYTSTYLATDNYALANYGIVKTLVSNSNLWGGTKNGIIWNGDAGAGNVGIGTTAPNERLSIGNSANMPANISMGDWVGMYLGQANSAWDGVLGHNIKMASDNTPKVAATHGTFGYRAITFGYSDLNTDGIRFYTYNGSVTAGGALGNQRMIINNAGNVGIGKGNPSTLLDVNGTVTANAFSGPLTGTINAAYVSQGIFGNSTGAGTYSFGGLTTNSYSHFQWTGATYYQPSEFAPQLLIRQDNATTGTNGFKPALSLYNDNGSLGSTVGLAFVSKESNTGGNSVDLAGIMAVKESAGTNGAWSQGGLNFFVKNYGAKVDAMYINNAGNVGIGTTTPVGKLDVNGTIYRAGLPFLSGDAIYHTLYKPSGSVGIYLGGTGDPSNYYDASSHYFRNTGGGSYYMTIASSGNVGIGTNDPGAFKLKVVGDVAITGTLQTQTGSDFAEEFKTTEVLAPGTVVVMGDLGYKSVKPSSSSYDKTVVGIVSDNPSIIAGRSEDRSGNKAIVAMMGVVKVKVCDANGQIEKGDLLTTANVKGYAMKAKVNKQGTIIGKALEDLDTSKGEIRVLVNLQ